MVGDGTELTVGEAQARLNVSDTTVRSYVAANLLRARWTGGGHTRVEAASVTELLPLLRIPPGAERDKALAEQKARNLAMRRRDTEPEPSPSA
jgi:excisionase family DNA binding protein